MPTRSTTARTTVERMTLPNGLRVLVAPDRTSPRVGVAVIYDVGFRTEPEGLTGFAHLFEHLMFQGSANVGKSEHMQLVQGAGGQVNGNTQADMTRYFEAVPSDALELMLWCEADRMRSLALTEENLRNQIDVVKEEIKVNVLNRPYGGFPWIPLPALAFDTYPNAHNGYGDFVHLESASLEDAAHFYATYYTPLNAVLAVTGDTSTEEVFELAHRHFGDISAPKGRKVPPHGPYREPLLSKQRRKKIYDPLAPQPAFSVAFRAPDPEHDFDSYVAHVVLADLLSSGDASRLTSRLVYKDRVVTDVGCMIGTFGMDTFQMRDPILFQILAFHPGAASTDDIVRLID
ncbi:MAG TPA: pitrilysin family protein, partial [Acidimicrobiales bacterium]|nr:pitrilysin family protein [Acidimicrobiales bacterium]